MDIKQQLKQYFRDCGVEVLDDMTQPVMLLREDGKFVDGSSVFEDGTEKPALATSRFFEEITPDYVRNAVVNTNVKRVSILEVIEGKYGPAMETKYVVRMWFE